MTTITAQRTGRNILTDEMLARFSERAPMYEEVQARYGVLFIRYWYDERTGKVFCLSEAPSSEAIVAVHGAAHGLLADDVVEATEVV